MRYSELDYNQIVLLRKHEEGEGLIEFAKGEIEKLDKKAERLRHQKRANGGVLYAKFCLLGHISGGLSMAFVGPIVVQINPNFGNKTQPPPENRPWRGNLESIFPIVKSIWPGAKRARKIDDLFPKAFTSTVGPRPPRAWRWYG